MSKVTLVKGFSNNGQKNVVTHNGMFHADEVFGIALLSLVFGDIAVIRTRDKEIISVAQNSRTTYVLDVGGVYDHGGLNFDHHHITDKSYDGRSSVGMVLSHINSGNVYKDYKIHLEVMLAISKEIDAVDNGMEYWGPVSRLKGLETISWNEAIASFNPQWNDPQQDYDAAFLKAVSWAKLALEACGVPITAKYSKGLVWDVVVPIQENLKIAEESKASAYKEFTIEVKNNPMPGVEIVVLSKFIPFEEYLFEYEKYGGVKDNDISLIIFQDPSKNWMVRILPIIKKNYALRLTPPKEWLGLSGEKFQEISGVHGAVFCHANGFCMSATTLVGAKILALKILEANK